MANPEHVEIINKGVKFWNKWRKMNPNLLINLAKINLSNIDLRNVNFRNIRLNSAFLRNSKLHEARLEYSDLSNVKFNNADLSVANVTYAKLNGAILTNASLTFARAYNSEFRWAKLDSARLYYSNFSSSNFFNSSLIKADLLSADLTNTVFINANLTDASLRDTKLMGAMFYDTNFSRTDFTGATIGSTMFSGVDLLSAKGLNSIIHSGPSQIAIETLIQTQGQLPEAFLQGCGLKGWEIEQTKLYNPNLTANQIIDIQNRVFDMRNQGGVIQYFSCFISYSHANKEFANRLHDKLQAQDIRCWLDEHQLLPGDDIHDMIDRGLRLWDKVLLCCSKESLTSWWVDKELDRAIKKEERLWKEREKKVLAIIPLNLDGFLFHGWNSGKQDLLTGRFAADFTGWTPENADDEKFEVQFERVVKALRADEGAREAPPVSLF